MVLASNSFITLIVKANYRFQTITTIFLTSFPALPLSLSYLNYHPKHGFDLVILLKNLCHFLRTYPPNLLSLSAQSGFQKPPVCSSPNTYPSWLITTLPHTQIMVWPPQFTLLSNLFWIHLSMPLLKLVPCAGRPFLPLLTYQSSTQVQFKKTKIKTNKNF